MTKTADDYQSQYTDPELREQLKAEIQQSDKGGSPGQWSARKAQFLKQEYEKQGGGYIGAKTSEQQHLTQWTQKDRQAKKAEGNAPS